ncbi:MAG: hypothetical protein WC323_04345 [Patescibacteria group bacterium]|jgi:thymidylate kinase/dUTPase
MKKLKNKGKLIVIYGINNLGKSTQAKMLVEKLNKRGVKAEYLKYPIYDLAPSGPTLNNYLRGGNFFKLSPREAQTIYTLNRTQYQKELEQKLDEGINIIAEDYTGTGLAWGIGAGVDEQYLKYINKHLLNEDLVILLDGQRFTEATEKNHIHEENEELINKVRLTHLKLAEEKGWQIINANQPIEKIHNAIWKKVKKITSVDKKNDLSILIESYYPEKAVQIDNKKTEEDNIVEITAINPMVSDILGQSEQRPKIINKTEGNFDFSQKINLPEKQQNELNRKTVFYSDDYYTLYEGEQCLISTGIKMQIPNGCAGFIYENNEIKSSGLRIMGKIINSGYNGEIKILLMNLSDDVCNIFKGQQIAQILIKQIKRPTF